MCAGGRSEAATRPNDEWEAVAFADDTIDIPAYILARRESDPHCWELPGEPPSAREDESAMVATENALGMYSVKLAGEKLDSDRGGREFLFRDGPSRTPPSGDVGRVGVDTWGMFGGERDVS